MKKSILSSVLAFLLLATCAISLLPAPIHAEPNDQISPQYIGIVNIAANLDLLNGHAECRGDARVRSGYTVKLVMVLKRNNVEFAKWETTGTGTYLLLSENCNISHGYVYQLVVTAYVYNANGTLVESPTISTGIKSY